MCVVNTTLRGSNNIPGLSKPQRKKLNVVPGRSASGTETKSESDEDKDNTEVTCQSDSSIVTENKEQKDPTTTDNAFFALEEMVCYRMKAPIFLVG